MQVLENINIFIFAGILAYVLNCIFEYFARCYTNYTNKLNFKRQHNNELFKKRASKLSYKLREYYYTLAVNDPMGLAKEISDLQIIKLKRSDLIEDTYTKMRASQWL